ncbi:hypothetical protein KO02_13555 [Sphingobacterium sp. ML3W]|uniref:RHS repeat-associated core domain-containing protein n=1 Tax=Sphingobacterium sp. ML3W TaxID=1538644 RepID=UPI0004F7203E|nr:RHS repeat-associated core domain-containing protein [Sphingobacterium sp. ML3W]AIM37594.1 hypothetical protein KO02_13555 [Sphingobacterium sp. ML3W]
MANKSTNTSAAQSETPALHSFEFDKTAIGKIKSSVNKFRGCVSMPLDLLTLPGPEGLDVKLSVLYSSNVKNNLNTWNTESPTGVLGIGWQMPIEMITVDKGGSGSVINDTYYLVSGGSANPMVKIGETVDGNWIFQLRNFEFWSVQYNPFQQVWVIIKENGFRYTYGEGQDAQSNATQWGVRWGNWMGASNVGESQVLYPLVWNLASIVTPLGHAVQYQYIKIQQKLISSGLAYTQASYLEKVTDSYGRIIRFSYGNKFGLLNPGNSSEGLSIIEYQPRHTQIAPPNPSAYQDRFETLFLDTIDVENADGSHLLGLKFTYDFMNNAVSSDPSYSLLYKRCLQSVFQYVDSGVTLPAINFEYFPTHISSINPGALSAVVYPEGGKASFEYKVQTITSTNSSKKVQITNPIKGSIPRVWFGSSYVVFTYQSNNHIQIRVQSWNGQWVNQNFIITKAAANDSIAVQTQENFFSLSMRNIATGNDEVYLFRNDDAGLDLKFGNWIMYNNQPFVLTVKPGSKARSTYVAGNSFVIAYNTDYTTSRVQGFSYNWQNGRWSGNESLLLPDSSYCTFAAITAAQNFYAVSCYIQDSKQVKNYLFYRTADGTWKLGNTWFLNNTDIVIDDSSNTAYLVISPSPSSLVLTFATSATSTSLNYSLRLYNWDENFFVLNSASPGSADSSSPIVDNMSLYQIFKTSIVGSTVANNLLFLRNIGGNQRYGSVWDMKSFTVSSSLTKLNVATGDDVNILSPASGGMVNQWSTFNPNSGKWSILPNVPSGNNPTISGNYMTVGKTIYFRGSDGNWRTIPTQLTYLNYPQSIQNIGARYINYQDSGDQTASSYLIALKNGTAQQPQKLNNVKTYVPEDTSGTMLASERFLVTYPSSANSFDESTTMDLLNLDEINFDLNVSDTPVANLVIEDKFDSSQSFCQSYYYANSAEAQIVFNGLIGTAQYPLVTIVPGIKEKTASPSSTPEGSSQFYYSNGLAQQTSLYPSGGLQNYQNILNGIQLGQKDFDKKGSLVAYQLNYWTVYSKDSTGKFLLGGYARCEKTANMKDGILQWSRGTYDKVTGLLLWQEKSYFDSDGIEKNLRAETVYAYQIPAYAAIFNKLHIFTAVAMTTQSVAPADNTSRNYIKSQATTFRNWANSDISIDCAETGLYRLAPYQTFDWTIPGTAAPQFPLDETGTEWQLKAKVISRSSTGYLINEQIDGQGLISSFIYDKNQQTLVAKFPNGSLSGSEVSYYGFEDYETSQNWTMGSGASIIPNSENEVIDAHTGTNSLSITAASTGSMGIQGSFTPLRQNQQYVFSAWVKKPVAYNNTLGNASWKIEITGGATLECDFPDTEGQWLYVSQLITFPNPEGKANVLISCENANEISHVLIDNLRFTPLACIIEAYSYKNILAKPTVVLGPNGETTRSVLNRFQQEIISTNAADRTAVLKSSYMSRSGNQGVFSNLDPNNSVSIAATTGGQLTEFTHGSEWTTAWQGSDEIWEVSDAVLKQQSAGVAGTITCTDSTINIDYGCTIVFNLLEIPSIPLGVKIGSALTIQWSPQLATWQLHDASGVNLLPAVDACAFIIPKSTFEAQLQAGTLSIALCKAFNKAGFLLSPEAVISAGANMENGWTITSSKYRYALRVDGDDIAVYTMNNQWSILVNESTIVFWANGKMIFSYAELTDLAGCPTFFFGNQVAISQIATATNPMAGISFDDSNGVNIQAQQYAAQQMVIEQLISDNMGRLAVRTKPAYVTPQQNPMFAYCSEFAKMNWNIGTMTGLINKSYPTDNGYPFLRQIFETSPLSRVIEESVAGEEFRVNGGKSTRTTYTSVLWQSGLPIYSKKITVNPNDKVFYEVSTLLEQVIQNVSVTGTEIKNETSFDDAGNASILRAPNYFNPPANSQQSDWVTKQTFDYRNQLLSLQEGANTATRFIYDASGNLRFKQDPQGVKDGNFIYTNYDILSRPIETGFIVGSWDEQMLQQYAHTEPSWPQNIPTWRQRNLYDLGSANTIGRISNMQANNSNNGLADVMESILYDILGNTISDTLTVHSFDSGTDKIVTYQYNDIGTITQIEYPDEDYAYTVYYQLNSLNQIVCITDGMVSSILGSSINTIGNYSYDAAGKPLENQLALAQHATIKQTYGFNSPNWLESINNESSTDKTLFTEALKYTSGGYKDTGYFDGTIASTTIQVSDQDAEQYQYAYDSIGQIQHVQNVTTQPQVDVEPQINYDANGNILNFPGIQQYMYNYDACSQQVNNVMENGRAQALAQFTYDDNGNALSLNTSDSDITKASALTFTYDPVSMLPVTIKDGLPAGANLNLLYGCRNERLVKTVTGGATTAGSKLYIRGTNAMPLQETFIADDGKTRTSVNYVYGPGGLIAMRKFDGVAVESYHILKDHLGSVRAVIDFIGNLVASYQYQTFGALTNVQEPIPGFLNYLYTGQEYDLEIGLYNYRARLYCAAIGRFIATDPGRQYFSPYIYASNNPVLFIDPTGMYSIGSIFSAIGGILLGAIEILVGVVIDVVAAVVEVLSLGLGTPATIGLAALSGVFYGAGISAITYSAFNFDDFSWKDYGIQMGIGALTGAFTGGLGAGVGIAAKSAQVTFNEFAATARIVGSMMEGMGEAGAATVLKTGAWIGEKGGMLAGLATNGPVASGWGTLAKGIGTGIIKSEVIGVSTNTSKNLALGNNWDAGLSQVAFSSVLSGSIGGMQISNRIKY